jgi:hypothetical protein
VPFSGVEQMLLGALNGTGGETQWCTVCLACGRTWVPSLVLPEKRAGCGGTYL